MVSLLFSFHGRINRKQYWMAGSLVGILGMVGFITLIAMSGLSLSDTENPLAAFHALSTFAIFAVPLMLAISWAGYAIQVKRLHDRGRTGYLALLPVFVSMGLLTTIVSAAATNMPPQVLANEIQPWWLALQAINLWFFIDLGCLGSVEGPNKFGDPPGTPRATANFDVEARPAPIQAPKNGAEAANSLFGAQSAMDRAIAAKEAPQLQRAMPARTAAPAPAVAKAPSAPASFGRRVPR